MNTGRIIGFMLATSTGTKARFTPATQPNCAAISVPVAAANWNWPARVWSSAPTVGRRYS